MAEKRQFHRYIIKFPAEIRSGNMMLRGKTVRVSKKGFFIRSQKNFQVGVPVDIQLSLNDESSCCLKGIVRFEKNFDLLKQRNGMGIEITEENRKYLDHMCSVEEKIG